MGRKAKAKVILRRRNLPEALLLNRLREMILSGSLGPGARVTEEALAAQLGVSRTPVRNLMRTVAAQGLIQPVGRRGYAVRAFSDKESWEALEIRSILEGHAARQLAHQGASDELLSKLDECLLRGDRLLDKRTLDKADEQEYGAMNEEFHRTIVEASNAPLLQDFVERANLIPFVAPSVIVFDQVGIHRAFELLFRAHGCHHAIVDAIRERDGGRAEALFREHAHHQQLSMFTRRANSLVVAGRAAVSL